MSPPRNARIACAYIPILSLDLGEAYRSLRLLHPIMSNSPLSDDSSTDEETRQENQALYPILRTTTEEREYNTIPGSSQATIACLMHRTAQANPLVRRFAQERRPRRQYTPYPTSPTTPIRPQPAPNQSTSHRSSSQQIQPQTQRYQQVQLATPPNRVTSTICTIS